MVKDINKLIPDIQNKMEQFKQTIAYELEREAVNLVPVKTGNLKDSITSGVDGDTVWVGAGFTKAVSYAKFVEFGTLPHIIRPKHKKALKFKVDKDTVFAKEVRHPGTRPQPFLRPAIFVVSQRLDRIFKYIFGGSGTPIKHNITKKTLGLK